MSIRHALRLATKPLLLPSNRTKMRRLASAAQSVVETEPAPAVIQVTNARQPVGGGLYQIHMCVGLVRRLVGVRLLHAHIGEQA